MAYVDFPESGLGKQKRKDFWLSPDGITLIASWRREGMSMTSIAKDMMGVSYNCLKNWMKECDALRDAIAQNEHVADAMVEASLLRRACGYEYTERTEGIDPKSGKKWYKESTRHIPPDTKACLAWLFSRRPDRWRERQEPLDTTSEEIKAVGEVMVKIEGVAVKTLQEGSQNGD